MYLLIPTWLIFLFLVVASFAPLVSVRPTWWMPYYGALLVCWIVAAITALRQAEDEERAANQRLLSVIRKFRDVEDAVE
jgi:hypothetical protein